jgi:hypothetical protein
MADIHCRKCKALVLRTRDGIGRLARGLRANLTWVDGRQVNLEGLLACRECGDAFVSIDLVAAETS